MICHLTARACGLWVRRIGIGLGCMVILSTGCRSIRFHNLPATANAASANAGPRAEPSPAASPQEPAEIVQASFEQDHGPALSGPDAALLESPTGLAETGGLPAQAQDSQATLVETIDLGVALRLAGVANPTIALAQERIREALAGQLDARTRLLPSINVGGNFYLHRGAFQASGGFLREPNSQSLYLGGSPGAIGSGSVAIPGVWLLAHLGDAVYEPAAARQRVAARSSEAEAVENAVLLEVSAAYLELAGAESQLDVLRRGVADVGEIVRLTSAFAKSGQGAHSDANRAAAHAELVNRQVHEAEGRRAAAAARLARLLTLDAAAQLHCSTATIEPFRLIDEDADLESLIALAEQARPELLARAAALQEARIAVGQEKVRPWLPLLAVGYSGGAFGGGSNLVADEFSPLRSRSDLSVVAVWTTQNLGVGNHARVVRARALAGQAAADYQAALNQVRREVAEAQAAAKAAARQIQFAQTALSAAEDGFRLETERIKQGQGRPIEILDSFRQLLETRQELVRAITAFDVAQFQLFVAIGSNPAAALPVCAAAETSEAAPERPNAAAETH